MKQKNEFNRLKSTGLFYLVNMSLTMRSLTIIRSKFRPEFTNYVGRKKETALKIVCDV